MLQQYLCRVILLSLSLSTSPYEFVTSAQSLYQSVKKRLVCVYFYVGRYKFVSKLRFEQLNFFEHVIIKIVPLVIVLAKIFNRRFFYNLLKLLLLTLLESSVAKEFSSSTPSLFFLVRFRFDASKTLNIFLLSLD
jgi:hypothetical protein